MVRTPWAGQEHYKHSGKQVTSSSSFFLTKHQMIHQNHARLFIPEDKRSHSHRLLHTAHTVESFAVPGEQMVMPWDHGSPLSNKQEWTIDVRATLWVTLHWEFNTVTVWQMHTSARGTELCELSGQSAGVCNSKDSASDNVKGGDGHEAAFWSPHMLWDIYMDFTHRNVHTDMHIHTSYIWKYAYVST